MSSWSYSPLHPRELDSIKQIDRYKLEDPNDRFFHVSYPYLINEVARLKDRSPNTGIWTVAHMAYGWMPRMLRKIQLENFGLDENEILTTIRKRGAPEILLKKMSDEAPIGGSWIGTSKVLHLINPGRFPIWDRHVAHVFELTAWSKYNSRAAYQSYCRYILANKNHTAVDSAISAIKSEFGYTPTRIRALELTLFLEGKAKACARRAHAG